MFGDIDIVQISKLLDRSLELRMMQYFVMRNIDRFLY
jgi:hypothetical protein